LVLAIACDTPGARQTGGPPLDFTIGGIAFHLSDGAAVLPAGGGVTFYLSDQPNACMALQLIPIGTTTTFVLHLLPPSDGTTKATIVAKTTPQAGEAVGSLARATAGHQDTSIAAADGSISWTANPDGSYALDSLDAGFSGTTDRLKTGGLTLRPCKP
jgi:hypothetical protein